MNILDDKRNKILEKLDVDLITLELRCIIFEKLHDFGEERKLRVSAEEKINELKRLKEEVEDKEDDI